MCWPSGPPEDLSDFDHKGSPVGKRTTKSSVERSLALLKKEGYVSAVVEKFNRYAGPFGQKFDLYGIIDVLAIKPRITLGVQACFQDVNAHIDKAMAEPRLWDWLDSDERQFEIWGWRKLGPKHNKKFAIRRIVFQLVKGGVVYYEDKHKRFV